VQDYPRVNRLQIWQISREKHKRKFENVTFFSKNANVAKCSELRDKQKRWSMLGELMINKLINGKTGWTRSQFAIRRSSTCGRSLRTLSATHRNVIGPAVSRSWPGLDFKMVLHHVRYVRRLRRIGHDWASGGWCTFTAVASGRGQRRWCCWSSSTSKHFRRLMAFYQAVDVNLPSYFHSVHFKARILRAFYVKTL